MKKRLLKIVSPLDANGKKCLRRRSQRQVPSPAMVQQPQQQVDDIYLCDHCDAEFVGLQSMQVHTDNNRGL